MTALRNQPTSGQLRWIGDVALIADPSEPDAERLARQLAAQPEVEYAQPNYIRKLPGWWSGRSLPLAAGSTDPLRQPTDPDYQKLQWNFTLINMPGAWTINPGGTPAVTVAVIDTGATSTDSSLTGKLWTGAMFETRTFTFSRSPDLSAPRLLPGVDFVDDENPPVRDMVGHGTHVASTIGEDANTKGLIGIAYNVRILPLKACFGYWEIMLDQGSRGVPGFIPPDAGGCPDDIVAEAIRYAADNGAQVINLSLGGSEPSPIERDALVYAVQHGVFVSIAAGNEFEFGNPIEFPAAYGPQLQGVMTVGAVGKSQTRAYYSNTGNVEISAPGGNHREGIPDDFGLIWQVTLNPDDQDPGLITVPRFDRFAEVGYEGTSMAAPHIAGLAALLMTQGQLKDPKAIEALIKATAKDIGIAGRDDATGSGLVQARNSLYGMGIRK